MTKPVTAKLAVRRTPGAAPLLPPPPFPAPSDAVGAGPTEPVADAVWVCVAVAVGLRPMVATTPLFESFGL